MTTEGSLCCDSVSVSVVSTKLLGLRRQLGFLRNRQHRTRQQVKYHASNSIAAVDKGTCLHIMNLVTDPTISLERLALPIWLSNRYSKCTGVYTWTSLWRRSWIALLTLTLFVNRINRCTLTRKSFLATIAHFVMMLVHDQLKDALIQTRLQDALREPDVSRKLESVEIQSRPDRSLSLSAWKSDKAVNVQRCRKYFCASLSKAKSKITSTSSFQHTSLSSPSSHLPCQLISVFFSVDGEFFTAFYCNTCSSNDQLVKHYREIGKKRNSWWKSCISKGWQMY